MNETYRYWTILLADKVHLVTLPWLHGSLYRSKAGETLGHRGSKPFTTLNGWNANIQTSLKSFLKYFVTWLRKRPFRTSASMESMPCVQVRRCIVCWVAIVLVLHGRHGIPDRNACPCAMTKRPIGWEKLAERSRFFLPLLLFLL